MPQVLALILASRHPGDSADSGVRPERVKIADRRRIEPVFRRIQPRRRLSRFAPVRAIVSRLRAIPSARDRVEISPELHEIAQRNSASRQRAIRKIELSTRRPRVPVPDDVTFPTFHPFRDGPSSCRAPLAASVDQPAPRDDRLHEPIGGSGRSKLGPDRQTVGGVATSVHSPVRSESIAGAS